MPLLLFTGGTVAAAPLDFGTLGTLHIDYNLDTGTYQDDARTIPAVADGDVIGGIADQSGNGNHASQSTTADKSVLRLNAANAHAAAAFDGAGDLWTLPDLSGLTGGEVFVVIKWDAEPSSGLPGFWSMGGTGGAHPNHIPWLDGIIYDSFGSTIRRETANPTPSMASWCIYNVASAAGAWTNWLNNGQLFTTATNTVAFPAAPTMGSGFAHHYTGRLARMLLYSAPLTSQNRTTAVQELATMYGVTL